MSDNYDKNNNYRKQDDRRRNDYDRKGNSSSDDRNPRSGYRSRQKPFFRKKVCRFCTQKISADYKNPELLKKFTTDRGKILPRRITGTCAKHQRLLAKEIKKARSLAFLPFVKR